ncbi:hypothetical protein [Caedibacter taeniospiralis]|jgi:hypothetical protein|uniref:hypothetical protein n=1 Tax=Caedibacter taeniospiralis TaxID=28907 RepID=UPI0037BEE810
MSGEDVLNTFQEKLYECNKHIEKIEISKNYLATYMPINLEAYLALDEVTLSFIDRLIYRFLKLQDTMGEKIFPAILLLAKEDVKKKTFIDILNRLEELEIVDKNEWLNLREVRNEIAHEYSFNTSEVVDSINLIYHKSDMLAAIYKSVCEFCRVRFNIEL